MSKAILSLSMHTGLHNSRWAVKQNDLFKYTLTHLMYFCLSIHHAKQKIQ